MRSETRRSLFWNGVMPASADIGYPPGPRVPLDVTIPPGLKVGALPESVPNASGAGPMAAGAGAGVCGAEAVPGGGSVAGSMFGSPTVSGMLTPPPLGVVIRPAGTAMCAAVGRTAVSKSEMESPPMREASYVTGCTVAMSTGITGSAGVVVVFAKKGAISIGGGSGRSCSLRIQRNSPDGGEIRHQSADGAGSPSSSTTSPWFSRTWIVWCEPLQQLPMYDAVPPSRIVASPGSGVFISSDSGATSEKDSGVGRTAHQPSSRC